MLKYFVAEGVVTSQPVLVASQDVEPSKFVSELPAVVNDLETEVTNSDHMKIAWRYQNMRVVDSSPTGSQAFGHFYDLTKSMQQELLEQADIKEWHQGDRQNDTFENTAYSDLLRTVQETLHNGEYSVDETPEKRKILRIAIHSLGSRLWLCDTVDSSRCDLFKFLYCLRALLRNSYAVGLITTPVNTFGNNDAVVERIEHMSDIAIRLESFAGSAKETNPLFKDYHGLLYMNKLSALNMLAPQCPQFRDLAFKLRRKKFIIEILHLPPEFADTAQREQDDAIISGCMSGSRKNILDF
ncbi:PREDICTED: elongator complex protein 4 isoform X2 [Dinoponera quadriceps]|nr:PREDICTED: elongator complex protein 4 isoform X2 [Dinoponera quadriceps]XP_014478887.1 PREDICTED: elongator complex protein 4 isoform X2 [Dinoponera quadriceps]